jgi:hypothetical protein
MLQPNSTEPCFEKSKGTALGYLYNCNSKVLAFEKEYT